jgi:chromate transporter
VLPDFAVSLPGGKVTMATYVARTAGRHPLLELAWVFLKLGTIAFGGPAAHIAMMEEEVVRRRRWLSREAFLDYLGATNLIPGPNSTELAIHVGHARAGWPGLLVAGTCFIIPAALMVGAIAAAYVRFGALPAASSLLSGVKPVVIAIVVQALWGLARTALKTRGLAVLALALVALAVAGVHELTILFGAGLAVALARAIRPRAGAHEQEAERPDARHAAALGIPAVASNTAATALGTTILGGGSAAVMPFGLWPLFGVFLKIGAVLFGSGYVLLAFLRADLVQRLGWLTERQLLDAVAVGQMTPGPVFTTATFIGYVLGGTAGAAVATVGIFLPAFVFVAVSGPLLPLLRRSPVASAVLDGVNVASLALMAAVTWELARGALTSWPAGFIAVTSAVLLLRFRVNSALLVLGGAMVGMVASIVGAF